MPKAVYSYVLLLTFTDENCRRLLRVIYLASSQKCRFSSHLLEEIELCPRMRTLGNLSIITLREHRKGCIENFTDGLRLPGPIKSLILLEDLLQIIGIREELQICGDSFTSSDTNSHGGCLVDDMTNKNLGDYFRKFKIDYLLR